MSNHTPGPWEILDLHNEPNQEKIGTSDGMGLALVFGDTKKEAKANAKLIAAAPDMLNLLTEISSEARDYIKRTGKDIPWCHKAEKLIELIKG